eukprot:1148386-Pelagomonas_calceolata.AAC.11
MRLKGKPSVSLFGWLACGWSSPAKSVPPYGYTFCWRLAPIRRAKLAVKRNAQRTSTTPREDGLTN